MTEGPAVPKPVYEAAVHCDDTAVATIRTDNTTAFASFLRALADEIDPEGFKHQVKPQVVYRHGLDSLETK